MNAELKLTEKEDVAGRVADELDEGHLGEASQRGMRCDDVRQ